MQTTQIPPTWPKIPTENRFESLEKSDKKLNEQENKSENRTVEQQLLDVCEQRSKLYKYQKFVESKSKSKTTRKETFSQIKTGQKKNEKQQIEDRLHNLPRMDRWPKMMYIW